MKSGIRLVVGLGNPGAKYENTYHNAGMAAMEAIAAVFSLDGAPFWETHKKLFAYTQADGWVFMKPLLYMNESGTAVREASRKFEVPPENIILLHDDSDLPIGAWKSSRGRGAAGHHGVESAIAALGTNDFTRIRIGIRPQNERTRKKAGEFVLRKVTKTSAEIFKKMFDEIADELKEEAAAK